MNGQIVRPARRLFWGLSSLITVFFSPRAVVMLRVYLPQRWFMMLSGVEEEIAAKRTHYC